MLKKAFIQIYTGEGKGKTTAAMGMALRMAGAGGKTLIVQFVKKRRCSEHIALTRLYPSIEIRQYGRGCFIKRKPNTKDKEAAKRCIADLKELIPLGNYDLIILDEINVALNHQLIDIKEVLDLLAIRNKRTEIVLTGRNAPDALIEQADLVTEMRNIKHYSKNGIKARLGIEK